MRKWDTKQKAVFFRGLSVLLNSGVHIVGALECLSEQAESEDDKQVVQRILQRASSGHPLDRAMAAEGVFSELETGLVKVGMRSGALHSILSKLADTTEERDGLRRKMTSALIYPAFVLALCGLLLVFAPVLVFSDLLDLLSELKTDLPLPTKIYLGFSELVRSPIAYLVLAAGLAAAIGFARKFLADEERRADFEELVLEIPGIGPALKSAVSAEVTGALAVAYGSGLPLLSALNLSADVSLSALLRRRMKSSRETLTAGETLSAALQETGFFSPVSLLILQAGEEVGQISSSLESMAVQSAESTRLSLDLMQKLLEPLLLLFVGLVVGFIAIATLAPTMKMVEGL